MDTLAMTQVHSVMPSPVGDLTLVGDEAGLNGVYFPRHLRGPEMDVLGPRDDEHLADARTQLSEYFAGERTEFDLTLAPKGQEFQQRVWAELVKIPFGQTTTYGAIANALGDPGAAQAVGSANGRNPISIIVPCHRVIGAGGALTGYAGGLDRKRFLLELETPVADKAMRLW